MAIGDPMLDTPLQPLLGMVHRWRRFCRTLTLLVLPLLLSGCLQSDLTLRFDHHTHGQLQQTIALSNRGAALAQTTLAPWLADLKRRSAPLGGQIRQRPQTITLTVPFSTGPDLVNRVKTLFAAPPPSSESGDGATPSLLLPGWGPVPYELVIAQTNWSLASRTHLIYHLDLRDLPANGNRSTEVLAAAPWADLLLHLQVPWGLAIAPGTTPPQTTDSHGATWQLQPGALTTIDVTFWLPNALAMGSLAIALAVIAGYLLRYRILPLQPPQP
jgi:hypothetical protein